MSIDALRTVLCALVCSRLNMVSLSGAQSVNIFYCKIFEIKQIDSYYYIKYKMLPNIPIVQEFEITKACKSI